MTVKELCLLCNKDKIFNTYKKNHYIIQDYEINHYGEEKTKIIYNKYKESLYQLIDEFKNFNNNRNKEKILFVVKEKDTGYESTTINYSCFVINKKDLLKNEDFTIWSNDENNLPIFSYDFMKREDISKLSVAQISLDRYGVDICLAEILRSIIFWGFSEEKAIEYQEEITKDLEKNIDNMKPENCKPFDEVIDRLTQEIIEQCDDLEEKEKIIQREKEHKKNKDRDRKYMEKILNENKAYCLEMLKIERNYIK